MPITRVLVASTGDDDVARAAARRLRDAGSEVVYAGGAQSAEQVARTAVAEDVAQVVLAGADADVAAVRGLLDDAGADDVDVTPAAETPRAPRSPR